MPFTVGSGEKPDQIAAGTYPATLEAVTLTSIVSAFSSGQPKDMREWHFLVNVNGEFKLVSGLTSMANGPASSTYKYLKALLRRELEAGEQIEDPIGQQCLVVIGLNAKGYSRIIDVLPAAQTEMSELLPGVPR